MAEEKIVDPSGDSPSKEPVKEPAKEPAKEPEKKPEDPVISKEEQHLANLNKAIDDANDELRKIRDAKKKELEDPETPPEEKDLKIDLDDPNSKAWDKHIKKSVDPVNKELDAEKAETFRFTLRDYLKDKPALAANPDRLRKVIQTYERIKENTGRTKDGILYDLARAYGAEFHEELAAEKTKSRIEKARKDAIYSDAGVSRGAGNYQSEREEEPEYTDEDTQILAKWNMTPQAHAQMVKELREKKQ